MKIKTLSKAVAAVATPEPISGQSLVVGSVKIKAKTTNTAAVLIGDSAGQNYPLSAGQELDLSQLLSNASRGAASINLSEVYVKVAVNGEGIAVVYVERN